MRTKRLWQFGIAGMFSALALQLIGYAIAQAGAAGRAENHALLNWGTLLFAPISFLFRLAAPDAPFIVSVRQFLAAVVGNAMIYAFVAMVFHVIFARAQQKLQSEVLTGLRHPVPQTQRDVTVAEFQLDRAS